VRFALATAVPCGGARVP